MTTGKTIALTRQTFVDKVMSLLFIYLFIYFNFFFQILFYLFIFLLYSIVLVLPYFNMNLPRVYTCSPS